MKTVVCSLIFFLLAVGARGLRQKSATTVFRLVHPDGIEDYFDGRNLTWQERAVESMTGEYILQDVVKGRSLARRWGLTEPEAMEVLKRTVLIRLYEESDITSLTVWSSTFSEAAELADAIRDAYEANRNTLNKERYERLIANSRDQMERQSRIVEDARLATERLAVEDTGPLARKMEFARAKISYAAQLDLLKAIEQYVQRLAPFMPARVEVLQIAGQRVN